MLIKHKHSDRPLWTIQSIIFASSTILHAKTTLPQKNHPSPKKNQPNKQTLSTNKQKEQHMSYIYVLSVYRYMRRIWYCLSTTCTKEICEMWSKKCLKISDHWVGVHGGRPSTDRHLAYWFSWWKKTHKHDADFWSCKIIPSDKLGYKIIVKKTIKPTKYMFMINQPINPLII